MRFPLLIANFCDQLTQPLHELTQSQDRARQAGSNDHPWKQLRVSLGKTGAPRTHVPSSAKEMSYSPKAPPTECHRNLQWQQPELRFEEAPRPGLQSHQKTSAASTKDRFHAQIVPLFLNPFQTFVNGEDLKADLKKLDERYSALPMLLQES